MHIAWTSRPEQQLFHTAYPFPVACKCRLVDAPSAARGLLPILYHNSHLHTQESPGAITTACTDLSKSVPAILLMPATPRFCTSLGSTTQPPRDTHSCHRRAAVDPTVPLELRAFVDRASPAGGGWPAPCCSERREPRRVKQVGGFTEEKLLCGGMTGKQLEQRAFLSSQREGRKRNRNLSLPRQKESYAQPGNRAKGSL